MAIAKAVSLIDKSISGGWRDELMLVTVLEEIDAYLLAVVQVIVAVGLYAVPGGLVAGTIGATWPLASARRTACHELLGSTRQACLVIS